MRTPDEIRADLATARSTSSPLSVPVAEYAPWVQAGHRLVGDVDALLARVDGLRARIAKALAIIGDDGCYCEAGAPEELADHTCTNGRLEAALRGVASRSQPVVSTGPL